MNIQGSLASFQHDFARALFEPHAPSESAPWLAQPAFAVYRNTVAKACIDALEANYSSVVRLVGRDWFRSAAALFVARHPPQDSSLVNYGGVFESFLRNFEPARELVYLASVARLDRFWTESHVAADARPLSAAQLAQLSPGELMTCRLEPHPAARWAWFDQEPIYSIWHRNRLGTDVDAQEELTWQGEGALLTRPDAAVRWQPAGRADCAFLDACAAGQSLSVAAERAHEADPLSDLVAVMARLLAAGAIADLTPPTSIGEPS